MSPLEPLPPLASFERVIAQAEARGLAGVSHEGSIAGPALGVAGTIFARLHAPGILAIACPQQQKALLIEISPDIYFDPEGQEVQPELFIRLDRIGDEELSLRLHDAWHFRAPDALKSAARPNRPLTR